MKTLLTILSAAVITNISYVLAGTGILNTSLDLLAVGVSSIMLGIYSGIHHYYGTRFTRKLDYLGMYMVFISIILHAVGFEPMENLAYTIVMSSALAAVFGAEPSLVGGGIGLVMLLLLLTAGVEPVLKASTYLGIAFVFNFLGDGLLFTAHKILHGVGWHIPSAYAILITAASIGVI